ncbi:MAG: porphobilinogen synthase [Dehalococcoidia bacterium]
MIAKQQGLIAAAGGDSQAKTSGFPAVRLRRMRRSPALRAMARETSLSPHNFIYPIFVTHGRDIRVPIEPMPGQYQVSVDRLLEEAAEAQDLGIHAVLLFGLPPHKDPLGTGAYAPDGIVQEAVAALKRELPDLVIITDVCLCEYTDHGHCGVLLDDGNVENDATLELLAKTAVSHAAAGADIVAPSAMMDGQVAAIREGLDAEGMTDVPIMAYASKFASAFYGPFRVAAESAPRAGDRKAYQMDGANVREALREMEMDVQEGADFLMVKPALPYLDVLAKARERFGLPLAAYNVSGEYAMLKAAAANGWLDEQTAMLEMLTSIKRAGADLIITYFAKDAARALREGA